MRRSPRSSASQIFFLNSQFSSACGFSAGDNSTTRSSLSVCPRATNAPCSTSHHFWHVQVHEDDVEGIRPSSLHHRPEGKLPISGGGDVGVANAFEDAQRDLHATARLSTAQHSTQQHPSRPPAPATPGCCPAASASASASQHRPFPTSQRDAAPRRSVQPITDAGNRIAPAIRALQQCHAWRRDPALARRQAWPAEAAGALDFPSPPGVHAWSVALTLAPTGVRAMHAQDTLAH